MTHISFFFGELFFLIYVGTGSSEQRSKPKHLQDYCNVILMGEKQQSNLPELSSKLIVLAL